MTKRKSILDAVKRASEPVDRFEQASKTLSKQPTGFSHDTPNEYPSNKVKSNHGTQPKESHYEEVRLELIDDNPLNARHIYLPNKIAELAKSIRQDGQLVPGLAVRDGSRYTLIAGHYRKRALIAVGVSTMRLLVYESLNEQSLYTLSYKENVEHNEQTTLDNVFVWRSLLEKGVFASEDELAQALSLSRSTVNKTLSIARLPNEVLDVISEHPAKFGLSVLYELVLISQHITKQAMLDLTDQIIEGKLNRDDIKRLRDNQITQRKRGSMAGRSNLLSRQYRFFSDNERIGQLKEWDDGKVQIEVVIEDEQAKAQFIAEMRKRFGDTD